MIKSTNMEKQVCWGWDGVYDYRDMRQYYKRIAKEEIMNPIVRHESVEESGGDLFTMSDFVDMCKAFAVMNDDGSGYLSDGEVVWNIPVDCRQLQKGIIPQNVSAFLAEFTHVVWFNK